MSPWTVGVLVHHAVEPDRIRQIIPATRTTCQVLYIDPDGRYVHGLVMMSAKDLRRIADSAPQVSYSTNSTFTDDAYRAAMGLDG